MMEPQHTRVVLPKAMVRAGVGLAILLGVLTLCGILLCFQLSSLVQHADVALSGPGGLLPTAAATVADTGTYAKQAIVDLDGNTEGSLGVVNEDLIAAGRVAAKAGPVLDGLTADEAKLGETIDRVNAPCVPGPCGTVADVGKTLNTVRGTFGQIEIAANHEDRNLSTLDAQEDQLFADFHGTATRANTSLDEFNAMLANPNIALMLENGGAISSTTAAVEKKLAQCTLHPTLPCVLKSDVLFGAQVGGYLLR